MENAMFICSSYFYLEKTFRKVDKVKMILCIVLSFPRRWTTAALQGQTQRFPQKRRQNETDHTLQ
jgi:hypothetical protein